MKTWRRLVISAVLVMAVVVPLERPSWGQASPPTTDLDSLAPAEQLDADTVVHSWALAPTFNDSASGGNRPNLSYEVAAGAEVQDQVTLFNLSNVPLTFRLYATDAFNNKDGTFDLLPADKKPADVGTWVTLPQDSITLDPRQQATMPITVKVPVTARPGDHAGAVLASSQAEGTGPDGKIITLDRRTGSRVYIRVAGPLTPKLTVEKLRTTYGPRLNPLGGTAVVTYRVQNQGNVRMGGRQQVSISGPFGLFGKQKASTDLPELLPGEGVDFRVEFKGDVPATLVALGKVRLDPEPVGQVADKRAERWRSFAFALPFTVMAVLLAGWLLWRARRNYLHHRDEDTYAGVGAQAP